MKALTLREIAEAVSGKLTGGEDMIIDGITTDSRKGGRGMLFVAIKGERFDGNDFAVEFLQSGDAVIVERAMEAPDGKAVVTVDDTKKALRDLAKYYREQFPIPAVGVTGSVGKTSTKDMIASVLSQRFNTLKTQGNFNNEIGLPLTVFNLTQAHDIAVLEMGMNNAGEISRLTAIAQPCTAVITNIGTAHIGNLGSQQNILKAKLEILEKLEPNGLVVLNADDKILWSLKGRLPHSVIYYGIENLKADVVATDIILGNDKSRFKVDVGGGACCFEVNEIGQHHIYNALAAIIVGINFKMKVADIINGVAAFETGSMRQSISKVGGVTVIDDCYNASAASMASAIKVLSQLGGANRTIAVLGDMLEQGSFAEREHRSVGGAVAEHGIDLLVTVGKDAKYIADEADVKGVKDIMSFDTNAQAAKYLAGTVRPPDTVLFKASRGMHFEEISEALKAHITTGGVE